MTLAPARAGARTHTRLSAFGTYLFLAVRRAEALGAATRVARQVVEDVDATCSRFRDDSDLTRANDHHGTWVDVDPLLVAAVDVACDAAERTDGLVNPLLGRALVQLGYDRDLGSLQRVADDAPVAWWSGAADVPAVDAWREIGRDAAGAVRVPAGTALDLGSVGKAWAADLIATGIERELGEPAVVSCGGDTRVAAPDGEPWLVAVSERPDAPADQVVQVTAGGLATSSTRVRRWRHGDITRHHVLDPRTGAPAPEVWRTVSATGVTCTAANTASTAAVVLGALAPRWLVERGVPARLVAADGTVETTAGWPAPSGSPHDSRTRGEHHA